MLLADGWGSVRVEMADDTIESVTTNDPYGEVLARSGDSDIVFGFTGEQYDEKAGLLYLQAW